MKAYRKSTSAQESSKLTDMLLEEFGGDHTKVGPFMQQIAIYGDARWWDGHGTGVADTTRAVKHALDNV